MAPRVCRLPVESCTSRGNWFTRPDFLFPSCVNDDGPSATIFFQGGDSIFGRIDFVGVSLTRRLLLGGSSSSVFLSLWPFVFGMSCPVSVAVSVIVTRPSNESI